MKRLYALSVAALVTVNLLSCKTAQTQTNAATTSPKGLKDYYAGYFHIGVSVAPANLRTDEAALIVKEFNSLTAENAMKMGPIHPMENEYFWQRADSIADFARQHNMKLRGHCLVWHHQTPKWFFTHPNGDTVSREVLLQRMQSHITTVMQRYKDVVYAWDVVNEAISDNPDDFYRNSPFLRIIGEDFIAKAFEYAHAADPKALLFYNDYNEINPVKREKILRMIRNLQSEGVPIHGVGLQAHWRIWEPTASQLDSTLREFSDLGLILHITELDINTIPKEASPDQPFKVDTALSPELAAAQAEQYAMCFEHFRKYRKHIRSVTFWNVSDRYSWLDNYPVRGAKAYPLLFDKNLKRKEAYYKVIDFKETAKKR